MAHLKSHVKRLLGWPAVPQSPAVSTSDPAPRMPLDSAGAELLARAKAYYWFHSIDLGHGVVTPGSKSLELLRAEANTIFGPVDLRGKSVLDIGAWNGNFSFEAKRRHAARVLATDHPCWTPDVKGRDTFHLAKAALNLEIEELDIDVPELTPDRVGRFDVVLFLGVFYHLVDPVQALQNLAALTKEVAIMESHLDLANVER